MNSSETELLRREIESLKAQISELKAVQHRDFVEINKLIKDVYTGAYQHIANLHDIVRPIEDQIFPHARAARKKMKEIVGESSIFANKKWDKKQG